MPARWKKAAHIGIQEHGGALRSREEKLVAVVPGLHAPRRLALDEEDLLVLRHGEDVLGRDAAQDVHEVLRHPVVPRAKYLYHTGIVHQVFACDPYI